MTVAAPMLIASGRSNILWPRPIAFRRAAPHTNDQAAADAWSASDCQPRDDSRIEYRN
jgi:hypothetical protein